MSGLAEEFRPCLLRPLHDDRRASVRYHRPTPGNGRVFIADSYSSMTASVLDLSCAGIGLLLPGRLAPGTLVSVELDGTTGIAAELQAEVKNAVRLADGNWRCGCELTYPLTEDEVRLLLK